jgi:glucose-6-phosphate dehydrogenase assembly protein OpcA
MSTDLESSYAILGQEVPLDKVDVALKELWGQDDARTKASLLNFAIYSEKAETLEANTRLLEEITLEQACRGLLILALPGDKRNARSWITAHCQLQDGHKSVCSEQISFLLEGGNANQVRNVVFAHLDSDLPLACWWQDDLTANFDERLYSVIDILFVDSSRWTDPAAGFTTLRAALSQGSVRFSVYDLSWLRSHLFRTALATCFQDAPALAELPRLRQIEIHHAAGHRLSALLLAAWVGVRMKCGLDMAGKDIRLNSPEGILISVSLVESSGAEHLQKMILRSDAAVFTVSRECGAAYVCAKVEIGDRVHEEMLPADSVSDAALISDQLSRLGGQSLYLKMVPMLQKML